MSSRGRLLVDRQRKATTTPSALIRQEIRAWRI
jgi:hypothetical protein